MGNCHFKTDFDAENITAVSKSSFVYQFCIGKGGFGKVWKVDRKKSKMEYAMKEMSKARILTKRSVKSVMNERQILTQLHNPFLVNMYYAFQDRENLYLVMDLLNGGDLRYHICRYRRFDEETTRFFVACLVAGLEYCHEKQIIHRDIKPENLVIDDDGYVRITDFGIARIWRPENAQDTSGTPGYMAPEVMCRQNHTTAVDYFAVGVMAYECMFGRRPYVGKSRKEIRDHILSKQVQIKKGEVPRGWSIEAADFVNKMIQRKPQNRLGNTGAAEVKSHPWLRDFPWQDLYDKRLRAPFIPPLEDNFDQKNINEEWKDIDDPEFKENQTNLRRNSVQALFNGYYYDYQLAALAQNQAQIHTGVESKEGRRSQEQDANGNILDNPELLLQQFNHQISLHQQQQIGSQPTLHISTNLSSLQQQNAPPGAQAQLNKSESNSNSGAQKKMREMSGNMANKQKSKNNMSVQQQQQIERSFRQSQQILQQQQQMNIRSSHQQRPSQMNGPSNSFNNTSQVLPNQGGSIQSLSQQHTSNKAHHLKNNSNSTNVSQAQALGTTYATMSAKQNQMMGEMSYASQGQNPYSNKGQSMPNTVYHSNTNSPVNKSSMMSRQQQDMMKGQYIAGGMSKGNSRTSANSMQGSPVKHQKALSMNMPGGQGTSKHPILANKQQKMQQQMQFKQTLNQQQQNHYQQNMTNSNGFKSIVHFAKSECPTPKTGAIVDGRKGQTQGRFFSRKNSNSNNQLQQSQNSSLMQQVAPQSASNSNQRQGFSPQQQQQIKLQKQLQQIQMKRQNNGQMIAGHAMIQNVPKNGFMINSATNSATQSRRTSQKSGKSTGATGYQSNPQPQSVLQVSQNSNAFKNPQNVNIYSTQQAYNPNATNYSQTGGQNQLASMMISNTNIYQTQSHNPTNSLTHLNRQQQPESATSVHTSQLRDSLQSTGGPVVNHSAQQAAFDAEQSGNYKNGSGHRKQQSFKSTGNFIQKQNSGQAGQQQITTKNNANSEMRQGNSIDAYQNNFQ